jgi:DNA helicase-4
METVHEIKPNFIQKIFGAKELKLNIKNYLISVSHSNNNQFDQQKIKNIKLKKGIFFHDIDVISEKSIQTIKKLTKNQSKYYIFILKNLKLIKKAYEDILNLTICKKYINHKTIEKWIIDNKEILKFLNKFNKNSLGIVELKILKFYKNMETTIYLKNKHFVEQEIKKFKSLFDKIEDNPLTLAQRKAIVTDEDSTLVVAGAGTGKTSTVVGKVSYLITKKDIKANEILALAYGKDAAEEMRERVKEKTGVNTEIRTFHALGKKIIESIKDKKIKISDSSSNDKAKLNLIADILRVMLKNDKSKEKIINFISKHRYPAKYREDFDTDTNYFKYMRKFDLITLKGELVKSFEELLIADWLFLNGVFYEYEFPFEHDTGTRRRGQYRPDFKLGDGIYLEHFGIDKNGNTAPYINKDEYNRSITWKRNLCKQKNILLIESYSWERMEGILLPNLKEKLQKNGIKINPNDPEIEKQLFEKAELNDRLVTLISDFLGIYKEGQFTKDEMIQSVSKIQSDEQERYKDFLRLFYDVFDRYQNYLYKRQEYDFADLLKLGTERIKEKKLKTRFKRIIVDEYQDISRGRYRFLKSIIDNQDDCRIMCVGDDWQSIYAFNGSDIKYTFNFEKIFGKTARVDLDKSFRFSQPILDVSSRFIQKNPFQLKKNIVSRPSIIKKTIEIINLDYGEENSLLDIFKQINSIRPKNKKWKVYLLGRYKRIAKKNHIFPDIPKEIKSKFKNLEFEFMTIHKSKGLGADAVIILNIEAGKYGFPGYIENDPIMNLVRPGEQDFKNAEERRVLYVALTRAKQKIILCSNSYFPSEFIDELKTYPEIIYDEKTNINKTFLPCPSCADGKLYLKRPKRVNGYAWSCSLEPYCIGKAKFCSNCKKYPAVNYNRCIDPGCENSTLSS